MAGLDGNPNPSLVGPPGSVRKSHLWPDIAKDLGIGIVSGVITTGLTNLVVKFVISKLVNYCVGERVIQDAPPLPNPTPADCVGVDIEGKPEIPYEAPPPNPTPADCVGVDIEGKPEIPYEAPPPNPTPADCVGVDIEGKPEIPYEAPPPNPTPADCVGIDIEGKPEIPYEAPPPNPTLADYVSFGIEGEPAIPEAAPLPNPPLSLLTLWRSFTVVLTNNFIARFNKRAAAKPAAPLEIDQEPSVV